MSDTDRRALSRAAFTSGALLLVLAAVAFWPAAKWKPPPRPPLQPPIVFDELVQHAPPPSEPNLAPSRGP